jgi:regulator of cell morphogenesis and NO signaling
MMNEFLATTVGQLVVEKPSRSRVFERFGIDYCCGGKLPLGEACARAGVTGDDVLSALTESDRSSDASEADNDWSSAPLTDLIDHILSEHHAYLRCELPRLSDMASKVVRAHGERFPWVVECEKVLAELRAELESHMMKEEQRLFPMIRKLEAADAPSAFHCGNLQNPITVMEHEHDNAGNALAQLRSVSNGFTPPKDACNTFRAWLDGLSELEADLHEHIHEENNILFPRAQQRESQLAGA